MTTCKTFIPITVWDEAKDIPMKGKCSNSLPEQELPYDPYVAWK